MTNAYKYLMSGKKAAFNKTSNYVVSMDRSDFSKDKSNYLGKCRSNFLGTEFTLYDDGVNPKKVKANQQVRKELGGVFYESNIMGNKGPRKMKVILPEVVDNKPILF